MINGKTEEKSVYLQIVHLKINGQKVDLEFSDTINKTRKIKLQLANTNQLQLYQVVKVFYGVQRIRNITTNNPEKY